MADDVMEGISAESLVAYQNSKPETIHTKGFVGHYRLPETHPVPAGTADSALVYQLGEISIGSGSKTALWCITAHGCVILINGIPYSLIEVYQNLKNGLLAFQCENELHEFLLSSASLAGHNENDWVAATVYAIKNSATGLPEEYGANPNNLKNAIAVLGELIATQPKSLSFGCVSYVHRYEENKNALRVKYRDEKDVNELFFKRLRVTCVIADFFNPYVSYHNRRNPMALDQFLDEWDHYIHVISQRPIWTWFEWVGMCMTEQYLKKAGLVLREKNEDRSSTDTLLLIKARSYARREEVDVTRFRITDKRKYEKYFLDEPLEEYNDFSHGNLRTYPKTDGEEAPYRWIHPRRIHEVVQKRGVAFYVKMYPKKLVCGLHPQGDLFAKFATSFADQVDIECHDGSECDLLIHIAMID